MTKRPSNSSGSQANASTESADRSALFFRRIPQQARSRQLVERILAVTVALLRKEGLSALSTNRVASEAGVDVASVYQYFASKEAILYALAERWLKKVQEIYARQEARLKDGVGLVQLMRDITAEVEASPEHDWGYQQLAALMETVPELRQMEEDHENATTVYWMRILRHYGVTWDDDRLAAFVRLWYIQEDAAFMLAGRMSAVQALHVRHWIRRQSVLMLRQCFPKKPLHQTAVSPQSSKR